MTAGTGTRRTAPRGHVGSGTPRRTVTRRGVVATVARNDLRRLGRDTLALFFLAVLPFVLIFAIGSFIPADDVDVVVALVDEDGGPAAADIEDSLAGARGMEVVTDLDRREAERDLRIRQLSAAVVVPEGFSDAVASGSGQVTMLVDPATSGATIVMTALGEALGERAAVATVERELVGAGAGGDEAAAEEAVDTTRPSEVDLVTVGEESEGSNFAFVAAGQMLLFMFVNSLTAGAGFIEMRRLGILDRLRAGPVDARDVLAGMGFSRFLVLVALAVAVAGMAALVFGVSWGSTAVLASVILLFALVCVAASALIGASFDDPYSAVSVGVPVGIAMAALGGCMFPLFLAPTAMQVAAKVLTPHAWALQAILDSAYDGDTLADVWTDLAVLALWATALLLLARMVTRRRVRT